MNMKRLSTMLMVGMGTCVTAFASSGAEGGEGHSLTHKMMQLAIQVGLILFAARLGGMLAEKMKMPGVLGELFAGIVIGPYALGGFPLGGLFAHGVFAIPSGGGTFPVTPELYGFCSVASIILLFLSGVETDMKMFIRYSLVGSLVGIGGVVVAFIFGNVCAVMLLPQFFPQFVGITFLDPAPLFLGTMSTATSVGITARILSEQKCIDSEEGVTTMAGAVIDDVLGIIVLAITLGVIGARGSAAAGAEAAIDWANIGKIALKALSIWLGATVIGVLAARKISLLLKFFKTKRSIAILSLGLALIMAGMFETQGLAMIIGAYVMGLALSRTDIRYVIHENLSPIYDFMVPVFFCVMGMMVNCEAVFTKPVLIFGSIYTLLAIISKVLGCSIPSMVCGFNFLGSLRIGVGMVPRGEVALIIAGIGLSNGALTQEIFGIGILMTLVTTLLPPPFLVKLFKLKKSGLRNPKSDDCTSRPFTFTMPSAESAEMMCEKLINEFRKEGFFTHWLSREDSIWQVSRDSMEIGIKRLNNEIHFECTPAEEAFIAAAILEVTTELTTLANELAKPIKTNGVAHLLGECGESVEHNRADAELARYLKQFVMIPVLKETTKEGVLQALVTTLAQKSLLKNPEATLKRLLSREVIMSTGLEHGIAIPHIRTDDVDTLVGVVAVVRNGISDYTTIDGSTVNIIIMTMSPTNLQTPHLRLIAHVGQVLDDKGRANLIDAKTEKDMCDIFLG